MRVFITDAVVNTHFLSSRLERNNGSAGGVLQSACGGAMYQPTKKELLDVQ